MSTESDESDYLIQYFSKMFQQKLCFEVSESPQILYIFTMSVDWKDWVKQYFGCEGKIFKRRKNYTILKIITDRVLFHDVNENGKNFSIRPTFHFKCQLGQKQDNMQYFLGTKFNQKESQSLEFKALKCDLIINNPEIIMKHITSMLNSSEPSSKIIIGIAYDNLMQSFVVAGCHCSEKKVLLVINAINEACKRIKVSEYVKVSAHECGAIVDGESRVVSDHKIFEIEVRKSKTLVGLQPGKYLIREEMQTTQMKLTNLFQSYKQSTLLEEDFIECLKLQDKLNEEEITKKKNKNQK